MDGAQIIIQAVTDPENQPSQFGTVPMDDPRFQVFEWQPISELDRTTDNTYLVRVENKDAHEKGLKSGWIDKAYYADDEGVWYDGNARTDEYVGISFSKIERGPWIVTAFAKWPSV